MADVAFKEGTASAYSKITPDSHTFYHTTDDDQVYLGSIPLTEHVKAYLLGTLEVSLSLSGGTTSSQYIDSTPTTEEVLRPLAYALSVITGDDQVGVQEYTITRGGSSSVSVRVSMTLSLLSGSAILNASIPIYIIYYDL